MASSSALSRFVFVDALRGLAALAVVLFHSAEAQHVSDFLKLLPSWLQTIIHHGHLGVAVFFVLSGFVISHSLFRYRMNLNLLGRFTLRRSLRLDPPYWIAIAISLAFGAVAAAVVKGRAPEDHSLGQLVAHVFYLQDILGYGNINPIFWTLCMEIQFYLVYAILLALGRNNPEARFQGRRTATLLLFAGLLSLLWPLGIGPNLPQGLFPPLWHGFLLGVGAYWAWRDRGLVPWFVVYVLFIGVPSIINGDWFSLVCVLTAATLLSVGIADRLQSAWNWRWLQFLGTISYSLYLIHNPITGATFRVGYMITGRNAYLEALWWSASIVASITFAWVMWWAVEKPSVQLARKVSFASREGKKQQGFVSTADTG